MFNYIKKHKLLLICFVVLFSSSFLASFIQTSFGKVDIKLMNLETPDGQNLVYDLYKPQIATKENQVPFIVVVPGFQRSKEALSNIAIELSSGCQIELPGDGKKRRGVDGGFSGTDRRESCRGARS